MIPGFSAPVPDHYWVLSGTYGGQPRYVCEVCKVKGYSTGNFWPPIRIGRFIMPEYRDCEHAGIREAQRYLDHLTEEYRKYGIID